MARNFLDVIRSRQNARDFAQIEPAEPIARTPAGFGAEEAGRLASRSPKSPSWDKLVGIMRDERTALLAPPMSKVEPFDQASQLRADVAANGIVTFTPEMPMPVSTGSPQPVTVTVVAPDTHTLAECLARIEAIEPEAELECVQEAILMRDWLCEQVKLVDAACKAKTLNWIETNKREITIGPVRYFAGLESSTRCLDVPATIEAILTATAGDFEAACACLSANAIKHGAASKTLAPDVYGKLFSTEKKIVLKEGKPAKRADGSPALQLIKTNDDFNK